MGVMGPARRGLRTAALCAAVLALASCDSSVFFADPAAPGASLAIHVLPSEGAGEVPAAVGPATASHGPARVFDRVDGVHVHLVAEGVELANEVFTAGSADGEIRLEVEVPLQDVVVPARLDVELRVGGEAVFRGGADVNLRRGGRTEADVALEAVPAGLSVPPEPAPLEALGDTVDLSGAVVFATGDTIPGALPSWRSLDPEIVEVSEDGTAVAVANGDARVEAFFGELAEALLVQVRQRVAELTVSPPEAELIPGETLAFETEAWDPRGNPVEGRSAAWSSSDEEVATVDAGGLARGITPGTVEVSAAMDDLTATAAAVVLAVPPDVETLFPEPLDAVSGRLRAAVNPRGVPVEVVLEWGPEPNMLDSAQSLPMEVDAGIDPVTVTHSVDLFPETTYYVRARASGPSGSTVGNVVEFTTPALPPPPDDLSAMYWAEDETVYLEWGHAWAGEEPALVFEVERGRFLGEGVDEWVLVATTTDLVYEDVVEEGGLEEDDEYAYRVRACVGSACSGYSNWAITWVGAPTAPFNLTVEWHEEAEAQPEEGMLVDWSHTTRLDQEVFEVERAVVDAEEVVGEFEFIAEVTVTEYLDESLFVGDGAEYAYRVRACQTSVCSDYSNVDSDSVPFIVAAPPPPG